MTKLRSKKKKGCNLVKMKEECRDKCAKEREHQVQRHCILYTIHYGGKCMMH